MADILKVFTFLAFVLCPCMFRKCVFVCGADMMNRRTLIELRQDVDFLRNLAIDFREEFDRINLWMKDASENITELLKAGHRNLIGDKEVTDTQKNATVKSLIKIKRRMDVLTSFFTAEKATLRKRTHVMSQQIQEGVSQLLSKFNQTARDVAALELLCKDESLALKSNLSDLNVHVASIESRLWKKVDGLSQQIKDGDSRFLSKVDQTNEKLVALELLFKDNNQKCLRNHSDLNDKLISEESKVSKKVSDLESQNIAKIDKLTQSFEQIKVRLDQTSDMINRIGNLRRMDELLNTGWVINGFSFYKHFANRVSFDAAAIACAALGSSLVQGYDKEELEFLLNRFWPNDIWLGATDRGVEGEWRWLNGRFVTEQNWGVGQPDNAANVEHCMMTGSRFGAYWNDDYCGDTLPYVCKI